MALDQIWKQQLTLVTYGNEFLSQDLSFQHWVNHAIFNQHILFFRDLNSQHLLAQHFQVWLEGLKRQGVTRLSLHNSSTLVDEKNPNPNVELLPYPHFIVSHHRNSKTAWICGKELAEWHTSENDYEAPSAQTTNARVEILWRFELSPELIKRVMADLQAPNWDDIQGYTDQELFDHSFAQGMVPVEAGSLFYGRPSSEIDQTNLTLSLLPQDYSAPYAHETLIRLINLEQHLQKKKRMLLELDSSETLEEEKRLKLFHQKLDELTAKFITKVANHYKAARLTIAEIQSPLDNQLTTNQSAKRFFNTDSSQPTHHKAGKSNVVTLIIITAIICFAAYYFGL